LNFSTGTPPTTTDADVAEVLDPLRGHRRRNAVTALKSLFAFAKRTRLVFTDPVRRLTVARHTDRQVLPMTDAEIAAVQQTAITPAQRVVVALVAVHAARAKAIRQIQLDHIDLAARPITIAGHRQALGELTREALLDWLEYRRASWPRTANPYLLISRNTALVSNRSATTTSRSTCCCAACTSNRSAATASSPKPWSSAATRYT
jgi:integrase